MKVIPGKMAPNNIYFFPFPHPDPKMMKRISVFLGRPTICLPWYMENLPGNEEDPKAAPPLIIRPPEELKPPEDFLRLLGEYRKWIRENPDRSCSASLAATRTMVPAEDARWEIQQMVRKGTGNTRTAQLPPPTIRWHLLLHLAREMEKERREAEAALYYLRNQDSPLKEAIGEEIEGPGLMDDLSDSLEKPVLEHRLLGDICEAWVNLFGASLGKESVLVAPDENILLFVRELYEEALSRVDHMQSIPCVSFEVTDPLSFPPEESERTLRDNPGHLTHGTIREIVGTLYKEGKMDKDELDRLISSLHGPLPLHDTSDLLGIEILSLPTINGQLSSQAQTILNGLACNSLVFLSIR
jgi:hypothetical protein